MGILILYNGILIVRKFSKFYDGMLLVKNTLGRNCIGEETHIFWGKCESYLFLVFH